MIEQMVNHNKKQKRFELDIEGEFAFVEYKPIKTNVWTIPHTFVPSQFSGKGIASQLVKTLLQYCKTNHIAVIPECPFVVKYIQRNPEWRELVMV